MEIVVVNKDNKDQFTEHKRLLHSLGLSTERNLTGEMSKSPLLDRVCWVQNLTGLRY